MSDQLVLLDGRADPDQSHSTAPQLDDIAIDAPVQESDPAAFLAPDALVEAEDISTDDFDKWGAADRKEAKDQRLGTENAFNEAVNQVVNGINIINNYPGSAPGAVQNNSSPVRAEQMAENLRLYVEPPKIHAQARSLLSTKRLVILAGEPHMGKQTAALNLLIERSVDDRIFAVSPNVDFDDDQALPIKPQCCYLIGSLIPALVDKLDGFALQRLISKLEASAGYLVITVNGRVALDHDAIAEYVIYWNARPPNEQVLQKHLARHLDVETLPETALKLCERPDVKRALAKASFERITRLAELLADVEIGDRTPEDAVRLLEAGAYEQIADWFRKPGHTEQRTFMIALAVFSGAKYRSVVDAARRLQALFDPALSLETQLAGSALFNSTRGDALRSVSASIMYTAEEAEFGAVRVERVVIDNQAHRFAVLDYVWNEYDGLRKYLLDWIRQEAIGNIDVREWAAWAAAQWGQHDLTSVQWTILQPWAKHTDRRVRRTAIQALELLASEPGSAPLSCGLLKHWSGLRNRALGWTAATAYAGSLGVRFPDDALSVLGNVARTGDAIFKDAIQQGIVTLFDAASQDMTRRAQILDTLIEWTDPKASKSTLVGLLAFIRLAQAASSEDTSANKSALLQLSTSPECGGQILTLWRRALNHQAAREKAVIVLRSWLGAADIDPALFPAVQQLIADLVASGDEREQQRLDYWLARWARDPKQSCSSAARIRAAAYGGTQA